MDVYFGEGSYIEGTKKVDGRIILSEHKLFLKKQEEDLADTYIPLEKIEKVKQVAAGVEIFVRPAIMSRYSAIVKGEARNIKDLLAELVKRRGLKKLFLRNEWIETKE